MSRGKKSDHEKSTQTRNKIIEVSVDLFSRKGFKGTSIRDIATEMDMSTSNIYHYFGTKAGVLSAIERQTLEPLMAEFRRISSLDLHPLERFKLLLRTHLNFMITNRKESEIFSLREQPSPHGKKDLNRKFQTETFFIYRSEIERLMAGHGKGGNSTIATFCALGSVIWFLRWYNPEGPCSSEEVIQAIIEQVLHGIIGEKP